MTDQQQVQLFEQDADHFPNTTTELIGGQLKGLLTKAGFQQITMFIKPTQPYDTVCAVGINNKDN